jgi:pterin-4a-carbinolamine dehydratase
MDSDPTENIRRQMVKEINANPGERAALEAEHGQVWDTQELQKDFKVLGFMAPFVVVERIADNVKGSLRFQHHPRYYFGWIKD